MYKLINFIIVGFAVCLLGCISSQDFDIEAEKYEVVNFVIDKTEIAWKNAPLPLERLYMDSLFIGVSHSQYSADPNKHDTIVLNTLHRRFSDERNLCKEEIALFEIKGSDYLWTQINKEGSRIDFSKIISKNAVPYKNEITNHKSLEILRYFQENEYVKGKKMDSLFIDGQRKGLLARENGFFEMSSPIFSRDKKTALIVVNYPSLHGGYAWILVKKGGKWEQACSSNLWQN